MQNKCVHCGENLYSNIALEGFCCFGCKAAYALINSLNLSKYYTYCKTLYNTSPMKVNNIINELNYLEHISSSDKGNQIFLLIEGIHCGACVWLIENTLKKQRGVTAARINLSTKRLLLEWSGEQEYIYELISILEQLGYRAVPFVAEELDVEQKRNEQQLLKCLIIAGVVSMQVMMLTVGVWVGNIYDSMGEYTRLILHLIAALITIPAVIYSGMPFFRSAFVALKAKRSNMDVPISIGVISSVLISIQETINSGEYTYYDAAISLLFVLLIGRYLDMRTRNKARREAHNLILSQPRSVTIYDDNNTLKLIDVKRAQIGQIAFIASGERIPIDGVVVEGVGEVDNSIITGETLAVRVYKGSEVFAGSINLGAALKIRINTLSDHTLLSEIIKLIENAEQGRAKYVMIADKVAAFYTPFVLILSSLTFCIWRFILNALFSEALLHSVAVLIITCPCALALAVPIVQIVAVMRLMKQGILVKTADALEKIAEIDTIVFDKTGTLTEGRPYWINQNDFTKEEIMLIASLANQSKHILLTSIKDSYNGNLYEIQAHEEKGSGLKAVWHDEVLKLGSREWCAVQQELDDDEHLEIWFAWRDVKKRLILQDQLRPEAPQVIYQLKNLGYQILLLSGDRTKAVELVASQIKIDYYESMLKPHDKYRRIGELQKEGMVVLMVGDGLNDAAALKVARASLSLASGLAITQNNADIIFQTNLNSVVEILSIAKKSGVLVRENLLLSLLYNVITIPIAMFGLVTPLIAALAMSSSSILVTLNAMRLNKR